MPYATKTLADLKQSLADRHDAGVLPTDSATLTYWTRLLNRAQQYCSERLELETSTAVTTSSGSGTLPESFISVEYVANDDDQYYGQIMASESEGASGLVYWITGDHSTGWTIHVPTDDVLTVYHRYRPAEMVNDSDECVIPDPEAVVAHAYAMLRRAETDPMEDADTSLAECERRLNEIQDSISKNQKPTGIYLSFNA